MRASYAQPSTSGIRMPRRFASRPRSHKPARLVSGRGDCAVTRRFASRPRSHKPARHALPGRVADLTVALFAQPISALIWNDLSSTRINSHSYKQLSVAVEGTSASRSFHSDYRLVLRTSPFDFAQG